VQTLSTVRIVSEKIHLVFSNGQKSFLHPLGTYTSLYAAEGSIGRDEHTTRQGTLRGEKM
jgi:hypothetical protein